MSKKFAVILSGCGYLDGAEIRESVLTLLSLDTHELQYEIFAPNINQHHVVNHLDATEKQDSRNILEESARIARGKVSDLDTLNIDEFSGLILPGGFGVAKNLSTFAFKGSAGEANSKVREIVQGFNEQGKPIGAICIAPALISLILGEKGISLTIGNDEATASEVEKLGAKHVSCKVHEFLADEENKIVTTPAYMYDDGKLHDIYTGINGVVETVMKWS